MGPTPPPLAGSSRTGRLDPYEVGLGLVGFAALVAAWAPVYIDRRPVSLPVVLLGFGASVALLPLGLPDIDPRQHLDLTERATCRSASRL